jgi:hypothetical protein
MDRAWRVGCALAAAFVVVALGCAVQRAGSGELHRWWAGFGPVLPHGKFPADCKLCHVGATWNELTPDFRFDHQKETGVPLDGAHAQARCLRCHNDRGPVAMFQARGCVGCHEDVHQGKLGVRCEECHDQETWNPRGQIERHDRTRFPLSGAHLATACHRCHPGANVGNFVPTDTECVTCHRDDLAGTLNPPHIPLGWTSKCDRCHMPTDWHQAHRR